MPAILTNDGITFSNATSTITNVCPAGTIITCCFQTTPLGFLPANGGAYSRTVYADLFAAIGTVFGIGNGSTTFNVPDLRGEFLRGWDSIGGSARGVDSGRGFGTFQGTQNLSHAHNTGGINSNHTHGGNTGNVSNDHSHNYTPSFGFEFLTQFNNQSWTVDSGRTSNRRTNQTTGGINNNHFHGFGTGFVSNDHSHNVGADGGGESRPRNIALNYFIKF